jgi:ferredoxin
MRSCNSCYQARSKLSMKMLSISEWITRISAILDTPQGQCNSECPTGPVQFWMPYRPGQCNSGCPTGSMQFWMPYRPGQCISGCPTGSVQFWMPYRPGQCISWCPIDRVSAILDALPTGSVQFRMPYRQGQYNSGYPTDRVSAILNALPTGSVQFWMSYQISAILEVLTGQLNSGCPAGSVQFWMPYRPGQCNSGCPTGSLQFWLERNTILDVFASLGEVWFHHQFGMSFQNSAIIDVISRHSMLFLSNSACLPCRMSWLTKVLFSKLF